MSSTFWLGIGIISVSGIFNGVFALPMKSIRRFRWENMWLIFSAISRFNFGVLALALVPHLWQVYSSAPIKSLMIPLGFGLLLGIGQVTYGLGIAAVGTSIAIAVVSGVSCVSGALIPLVVLNLGDLFRPRGILLLVSVPILLVGLTLFSIAGRRRDREHTESKGVKVLLSPAVGLAICIVTGILGSSINLGFAFSGGIVRISMERGASSLNSTYAVWALLFASSFVPNLIYTSYLLTRNQSWSAFFGADALRDLGLSAVMAIMSGAAFVGYGFGATIMGNYGTSVGWAGFVAATTVASTLAGIWAGEWKNTSVQSRKLLFSAVAVILAAVVVLDLGGLF